MRIRINLLPHREARRERQKKLFYAFTGVSFVIGLAVIGVVWMIFQGIIADQQGRNDFIAAENRKLDVQIKEIATLRQEIEVLRARQKAVEDLQADRNEPVYLMDEVARQTPEGAVFAPAAEERPAMTDGPGAHRPAASPPPRSPAPGRRSSLRRKSPLSRYQYVLSARDNVAISPTIAERIMLPVLGSR